MAKLTPMMQQYVDIKKEYSDCILFFRLGDFYEMFFEDAKLASQELEITLTQRSLGQEEKAAMCGVPHHVADGYISKLVDRGYKVAICEQVEDPSQAKGLVRRDVVRVVTPGTITDQNVLEDKLNNYLASIYLGQGQIGIAYVDNSTGELYTTNYKGELEEILSFAVNELSKIYPSEIICNELFYGNKKTLALIKNNLNPYFNVQPDSIDQDFRPIYERHFSGPVVLEASQADRLYSNLATSRLLEYLEATEKSSLDHIGRLEYYEANNYLIMDFATRMNLEIHETIISRNKKGSIVGFLDKTSTAMGGRLLRKWLEQPLINKERIYRRSSIVEYLVGDLATKDRLIELLKKVHDMERLASKISTGKCNARELVALKNSLGQLPEIKEVLLETGHGNIMDLGQAIDDLADVHDIIGRALKENPPIGLTEGGLIREGYNEELDRIRELATKGKDWLRDLETRERQASGINNLKIGFNKMLGYYFEISKANIPKAPDHFIRKQTLTNSERYFTEELKSMEEDILGAEEKLLGLEYKIFVEVREEIKTQVSRVQASSSLISAIDVLAAFAERAYLSNFVRPKMNNEGLIEIREGRHPVVENTIEGNLFVPNDSLLDLGENMIQIITGPNMAGKSTYMRQVAVITLLAHIGSFVPASQANISIVDRIFTRIGAADNLSQGESTFMVEMNEVSNIVRSATSRSLIILDEVGRGTSTYDGLSIAWALVEYLAENIKAKTLFATHYHELTELEESYDSIKNLTILAQEKGEDVIFLRKIVRGSTNRSYGIQVARLAGLDGKIIRRAREILHSIEGTSNISIDRDPASVENEQISLADFRKQAFIEDIAGLDINKLTPMDTMNKLYEIIGEARGLKDDVSE